MNSVPKHNGDCAFCQQTTNHSKAFLENEHLVAIYNIAPIVPSHSLVITKRHISSLLEMNQDESASLIPFTKRVVEVLKKHFGKTDFNLSCQNGILAGQSQPHLHFHVIMRSEDDFSGNFHEELNDSSKRPTLSDEEMRRIVEALRKISNYNPETR